MDFDPRLLPDQTGGDEYPLPVAGRVAHIDADFMCYQVSAETKDELDGITVEYGDLGDAEWWWFNVRASNTEPLLRLNLEASSPELRDARRDELVAQLGEVID